ncbi:unnamed protein product [Arctogadus glacialis]
MVIVMSKTSALFTSPRPLQKLPGISCGGEARDGGEKSLDRGAAAQEQKDKGGSWKQVLGRALSAGLVAVGCGVQVSGAI